MSYPYLSIAAENVADYTMAALAGMPWSDYVLSHSAMCQWQNESQYGVDHINMPLAHAIDTIFYCIFNKVSQ